MKTVVSAMVDTEKSIVRDLRKPRLKIQELTGLRIGSQYKVPLMLGVAVRVVIGVAGVFLLWPTPIPLAASLSSAVPIAVATQPASEAWAPFAGQPGTSPYPVPGTASVVAANLAPHGQNRTISLLTLLTMQAAPAFPAVKLISAPVVPARQIALAPSVQQYNGPMAREGPGPPLPTELIADPTLTDNWQQLFAASAISAGEVAGCLPTDAAPGAAANPMEWLVCGPFDASQASRFYIQYSYRPPLTDSQVGGLFFGVSDDGHHFQGMGTHSQVGDWITQRVLVEGSFGPHLWLAWAYNGDHTANLATNVRLGELEVWRYTPPDSQCGALDAGDKGVVLSPYDPTANQPLPMIRTGDTVAVAKLQAAGVHWVRLGFQALPQGLDLLAYDRMVDTLCAHDIRVLALLNHETLVRQDYVGGDEAVTAAYQAEFAGMAQLLSSYFAGRIQDWEVWNEPNLADGAYLAPEQYARLLYFTHQGIKRANPNAQVVFGGLASAWSDSNDYLRAVYVVWDGELHGARPFDRLAVHPYPRKVEGPDPAVYMYAERTLGYRTILDKFLQTMAEHGDGNKPIWITEIGWNSAQPSANRPACFSAVLVKEAEQARYLTAMYDILLHDVTLWNQPDQRGVEKIFWYQFMDVGMVDPCYTGGAVGNSRSRDWWFGLYRGDKVTPKPGWCAFVAYPQPCLEITPAS